MMNAITVVQLLPRFANLLLAGNDPCGEPPPLHTLLRVTESDLRPLDIGPYCVSIIEEDSFYWRSTVDTATLNREKKKRERGIMNAGIYLTDWTMLMPNTCTLPDHRRSECHIWTCRKAAMQITLFTSEFCYVKSSCQLVELLSQRESVSPVVRVPS